MHAWKRVGPGLQRLIVDKTGALSDDALAGAAVSVVQMLRQVLSSTVSGMTANEDQVTIHSGSVAPSDALKSMRTDALTQLRRLYLLVDEDMQKQVRSAMLAAGDTPNQAGYSDELGRILLTDLVDVIRFFVEILPGLGLEAKRALEVNIFREYYRYHALPPSMRDNEDLVAAQAALLEEIAAFRTAIESDEDLVRYRSLVGYDSVSRIMWDEARYDREGSRIDGAQAIGVMIDDIEDSNEAEWLSRLERYVQTRSNDLAMFRGLESFIKDLARAKPAILLGWLPRLSERLANWLPGMLHGLAEAGQVDEIDRIIEQWVGEDKHLAEIAWYLQYAEKFRPDLLEIITAKALATSDDHTLSNATKAAARQSNDHPAGLFNNIFLPAAKALVSRGDYSWTGDMLVWNDLALLKGLDKTQIGDLLDLMVELPTLDHGGEDILAVLAEQDVDAVLGLIDARFTREDKSFDIQYSDLPHSLYSLRAPLIAAPGNVIGAARKWFDTNPELAEYRGGRLIADLFPNLEHPIQPLLQGQILDGREGIAFVLSTFRAYEGQDFLHPLLRDIVSVLEPNDELLRAVELVIISTGVVTGEHGSANAQAVRQSLVAEWAKDERQPVRAYADSFVKSMRNSIAWERRRADQRVAMRKIGFED